MIVHRIGTRALVLNAVEKVLIAKREGILFLTKIVFLFVDDLSLLPSTLNINRGIVFFQQTTPPSPLTLNMQHANICPSQCEVVVVSTTSLR
jgi:hypothetical protein